MNYFKGINIFSEISDADQISFSDFCQIQNLKKDEVLFQEGDDPQALYIVTSGSFSIMKNIEGEDILLAKSEKDDLIGEMAFFWAPPKRIATVVANEESTLIVVLQFSMQQMFEKYPEIYKQVRSIIEERIAKNNNK